MENRIAELKHDLGANRFCLKQFHATGAAFRAVLFLFNLLAEFQRAAGLPGPLSPPPRRPHGRKLGRPDNEKPTARQYSALANPNFAEVGSGHAMLTPNRPAYPRRGVPQIAARGGRLRNSGIVSEKRLS
jgi:hypothetical protein